jgi:hypothetical protein
MPLHGREWSEQGLYLIFVDTEVIRRYDLIQLFWYVVKGAT